jgi:type II secretory pathway pseudopilin PulG
MIVPIIVIIIVCSIIAVLSVLAYGTIRHNSRLEREKSAARQDAEGAQRELEVAIAGKEALKVENGRLQQENEFKQATIDHLSVKVDEIRAQNRDLEEINSDLIKGQAAMRNQLAEQRRTVPIKRVRKTDTHATQEEEA